MWPGPRRAMFGCAPPPDGITADLAGGGRHVLKQEVGALDGLVWAKRAKRLPVVLTPDEVAALLDGLDGVEHLIVTLLYGAGLRVSEGVALRVKDVDLGMHQIVVRDG